jgi:hypothetical protein
MPKRVKPPAFTMTSPTSGSAQPGDTIELSAAKGFKLKRGVTPYKFYIGNTLIQPTFVGPVKREAAQLTVPDVPLWHLRSSDHLSKEHTQAGSHRVLQRHRHWKHGDTAS